MRSLYLVILLAVITLVAAAQIQPLKIPEDATELRPATGYSLPQVRPARTVQQSLAYSLVIDNRTDGIITVIDPPAEFLLNRPGTEIGRVLHPATRLESRPLIYHGARSLPHVDRHGADAVDLCLYTDTRGQSAGFLQFLPLERNFAAADGSFEQPRPGAVYLDIPQGTGVFGGAWPVVQGSPVSIVRRSELAAFSADETELIPGDIIIIEVNRPREWPRYLEVQNRAAGEATLHYADGTAEKCATVLAPLNAAEQFAVTPAARNGTVVSAGCTGLSLSCPTSGGQGFLELVPYEAGSIRDLPEGMDAAPWGVLTGVNGRTAAGQPPLFDGYLYACAGLEPPQKLPLIQVSVQLEGFGTWQPLSGLIVPEAVGNIAALRFTWVTTEPVTTAPAGLPSGAGQQIDPTGIPSLRR